ncbi:hypothetical protein [Streptomyces sp. NPDC087437]
MSATTGVRIAVMGPEHADAVLTIYQFGIDRMSTCAGTQSTVSE